MGTFTGKQESSYPKAEDAQPAFLIGRHTPYLSTLNPNTALRVQGSLVPSTQPYAAVFQLEASHSLNPYLLPMEHHSLTQPCIRWKILIVSGIGLNPFNCLLFP